MSKPTFRLNVAEFLSETSRLGPTIVGAYINIMLDYFEQGEAPPDEDSVLARIVGCDLLLWADIRPKLVDLFVIAEGRWTHAHVEAEIEASSKRRTRSKNAASVAAASHAARAGSNGNERPDAYNEAAAAMSARTQREGGMVVRKPTTLAEDVGAEDDGDEPAINARAHSELTDSATATDVLERMAIGDEDDDGMLDVPEPPIPTPPGINFESGLDPEFKPSAAVIIEHMNDGYTSAQIADVLDSFKRYNINAGTTSNNWPEMWVRWWNRKKPPLHPAEKKPKPRVEVSRRAPPPPQTE